MLLLSNSNSILYMLDNSKGPISSENPRFAYAIQRHHPIQMGNSLAFLIFCAQPEIGKLVVASNTDLYSVLSSGLVGWSAAMLASIGQSGEV